MSFLDHTTRTHKIVRHKNITLKHSGISDFFMIYITIVFKSITSATPFVTMKHETVTCIKIMLILSLFVRSLDNCLHHFPSRTSLLKELVVVVLNMCCDLHLQPTFCFKGHVKELTFFLKNIGRIFVLQLCHM